MHSFPTPLVTGAAAACNKACTPACFEVPLCSEPGHLWIAACNAGSSTSKNEILLKQVRDTTQSLCLFKKYTLKQKVLKQKKQTKKVNLSEAAQYVSASRCSMFDSAECHGGTSGRHWKGKCLQRLLKVNLPVIFPCQHSQ